MIRDYFIDKDIKVRLVDALFIKPMDLEMKKPCSTNKTSILSFFINYLLNILIK